MTRSRECWRFSAIGRQLDRTVCGGGGGREREREREREHGWEVVASSGMSVSVNIHVVCSTSMPF